MRTATFDALGLLVVPLQSHLQSPRPAEGGHWHKWQAAMGAKPNGLPADISEKSASKIPFKRPPGTSSYFDDHIERSLYPSADGPGSRWLSCPDDLYLDFASTRTGSARRARIELLERLTPPLDPGCTFGLVHLSLEATDITDASELLRWTRAISSPFSNYYERSELVLERDGEAIPLDSRRPIRALAKALFSDPAANAEKALYTVVMAAPPAAYGEPARNEWCRALAMRSTAAGKDEDNLGGAELETDEILSNQVPMGLTSAFLLRRHATFTTSGKLEGMAARNLRSYWAESIVFGLLQQSCLEGFQRRLAEIDNLLGSEIEELRLRWLKFRNVLWWSQLAGGSEIPQELIGALRRELGTVELFNELEGDLATYTEHRHWAAEEEQATALANLQIYGSGIVVLGPVTTIIGLVGATGRLLAALIGGSLLFAAFVSRIVYTLLKRGPFLPRPVRHLVRALAGLLNRGRSIVGSIARRQRWGRSTSS